MVIERNSTKNALEIRFKKINNWSKLDKQPSIDRISTKLMHWSKFDKTSMMLETR